MTPAARTSPFDDEPDSYLPSHGDRGYSVLQYDLELDYRVDANHLSGRARITVRTNAARSDLSLDLAGLRVEKLTVVGRRNIRYTHRAGKVKVLLGSAVPDGTELQLDVRYSGRPRPIRSIWGEVGWEELTDGVIVGSQPSGAPSWFPCNDRPDDKALYTIRITADAAYHVVANGLLTDRRSRGGRTMWLFEQAEPMATYLASVQIGLYDEVVVADASVTQIAAVPARLRPRFDIEFARQPRMMEVFEDLFGPYPFEAYTVVVTDDVLEIPLEAQGLSMFGANHVNGRGAYERLIAHELAHQWFGNSLTVARWRDVWLHEGFACYAEWLWSERSGGRTADQHARDQWRRLRTLPQDLVVADPGPTLMFDDRLYKRGAMALHALRLHLGDLPFFEMLRTWAEFHRYGSVTTEDFIEHAMRRGPGVLAVLDSWIWRRALPPLPPARA